MTNTNHIGMLGAALLIGLLAVPAAAQKKTSSGENWLFTYVEGQAKKKPSQLEQWKTARKDTVVETGDKVRTLARTRAEIALGELGMIRLAPLTIIDVVKYYEETRDKKLESELTVESGDIWANISGLSEDLKLSVSTAVANAAVRGTVFRVSVGEDDQTEMRVYRGRLNVSSLPGQAPGTEAGKSGALQTPTQVAGPTEVEGPKEVSMEQWTVIVREMQKIVISRDRKLVDHSDFSLQDQDEQTEWVRWNRARDQGETIAEPETEPEAGEPEGTPPEPETDD